MFIINEGEMAFHAEKIIPKKWGTEFWIVNNEAYCLKLLKINPGFQSSIHCHRKKDETFIGVSGTVTLFLHNEDKGIAGIVGVTSGGTYRLKAKQFHSFSAHNLSWIMEVSTHHDEKDVVRLQESRNLNEEV